MSKRKPKVHPYAQEIQWAGVICSQMNCSVTEADLSKYEIAKVKGEDVSLVIYPHKTTAGHHHARVRDNGSKDKFRAKQVMDALNNGVGLPPGEMERVRYSCTFSRKGRAP